MRPYVIIGFGKDDISCETGVFFFYWKWIIGIEDDLGLSLVMVRGVYKNSGCDDIKWIIISALIPSKKYIVCEEKTPIVFSILAGHK